MGIDREEVISAALKVLDREGIDGLSMRVLAKELRIQAPSLYWHFPSKQALIDALADDLIQRVSRKVDTSGSWDEVLVKVAHELRSALGSHRDGARVFGGTYAATENVIGIGEAMINALRGAGATAEVAAWGWLSISYYVIGFVIEEQDLNQKSGYATVDLDATRKTILKIPAERIPAMRQALPALLSQDFERRFDFGLNLLIEGLRVEISAAGSSAARRGTTRRTAAVRARRKSVSAR